VEAGSGQKKTLKQIRAQIRLLLAALLLCSATSAFALDVQLFRPSPLYSDGVQVYGTGILLHRTWEAGAYINWARNPIEFGLNDSRIDDIVNNFVTMNMQLSYGLFPKVSLAADLPLGFLNDIEPLVTPTAGQESSFGVGDLQLSAIYQLYELGSADTRGWGFAVIPYFTVPTGDEGAFFGQKNVTGGIRFAADRRFGERNYMNYNLGVRFREKETNYNLIIGQEAFMSVGYQRRLSIEHHWDLFAEIYGSTTFDHFLTEEISSPLELYLGMRKRWPAQRLTAVLGLGRGLDNGYGAPDVRLFAGVTYNFGTPPPKIEIGEVQIIVKNEDETPAPSTIVIRNLEGTADLKKEESVSTSGASFAPGKFSFEVIAEGYSPRKGTFRIADKRKTTIVIVLKRPISKRFENLGKVLFELDKADIKVQSHAVLNEVINLLERYPQVTLLRVEAHTDGLSSEKYNLKLSTRRAKSVMDFLIKGGIDPKRLTSQGFGKSKPIADNNTLEGRALNRRVEFVVLESLPENVEVEYYDPDELYNIEKASPEKPSEKPNEAK
jgi:OmpA-OmpF porin, OOP family